MKPPIELVFGTPEILSAPEAIGAVAEGWEVFPGSIARARETTAERPWGTWLVVATGPRTLIGVCGFHGPPKDGVVEIGYALAPAWRRRGLGVETAAALLAIVGQEPVESVIAHTLATDNPSSALLTRLGFVRDGESVDPDEGPVWRWRRPRHGADGFLGAWAFDPAEARYEGSAPPRDGRYALAPKPVGVAFAVEWTEADGTPREVEFEATFGEKDGLAMERVDARTLDTRAKWGPIRVARRTLAPDGLTMEIVQEGPRPDGSTFTNRSLYRRVAWAPPRWES